MKIDLTILAICAGVALAFLPVQLWLFQEWQGALIFTVGNFIGNLILLNLQSKSIPARM